MHAASPVLVGGLACAALLVVIGMVASSGASRLGAWVVAAVRGAALRDGPLDIARVTGGPFDAARADHLSAHDVMAAVIELVAPLVAAAAIVALVGHLAQTRAMWLPRRRIKDAPSIDPARTRNAMVELVSAMVVGAVAFGWLWIVAPRIAMLSSVPLAGGLAIASAAASFAIAWVAIGVLDALLRHRDLANALHMTAREKREDERLASGDPRWRAYRARQQRTLEGATLLLLGDGVAAAIQWDPVRRPIPTCIATGMGPRATQLLGLARRDRVPIHREPDMAAILLGPIAERHWPRLAEIIAAVKR